MEKYTFVVLALRFKGLKMTATRSLSAKMRQDTGAYHLLAVIAIRDENRTRICIGYSYIGSGFDAEIFEFV